ncbi:MAG: serine/threonine protein phosphatase [Saprospiraceae bacterium]|nr:MAG: serine/threonine protein phosphatase [Saprospiraceae bacterium]
MIIKYVSEVDVCRVYLCPMRKFAISDIHGCIFSLQALLDKIALSTSDELYLLGDYIDRGPDSKGVIDLVLSLQANGYRVYCLRGNHEQMLLESLNGWNTYFDWIDNWGGQQTMDSFEALVPKKIPAPYWDFFNGLGYFSEVDGYILVHAGLDFSRDNPLQPNKDMLYLRNWYGQLDREWLDGRIIVHGHTPVAKQEVEDMLRNLHRLPVIDIDGGCFAKHLPGKGYLCAFDMTNRELFFQKNLDDMSGYWKSR